jgi:hypothetical protein
MAGERLKMQSKRLKDARILVAERFYRKLAGAAMKENPA